MEKYTEECYTVAIGCLDTLYMYINIFYRVTDTDGEFGYWERREAMTQAEYAS